MSQLTIPAQVTNGSTSVLLTGDYTAQIKQNHLFMVGPAYTPYFIAADSTYSSGTGKTTVVLTGAWAGSTGTVTGTFAVDFTVPDRIPTLRAGDVGTATIFTQAMLRIQALFSLIADTGIEDVTAYAAAAAASATAAAGSATAAAGSASAAASSATAASGSATAAAGSATAAAGSATAAAGSASSAASTLTAVTAAGTDAVDDINTAKTDALAALAADVAAADASADLAQQWANNPVNTVVSGGQYSAYHWAQQAAASITGVMVYRGTWDASTGSYPSSPATGDTYLVSVAGTVSSVAYNVGDQIVYTASATWAHFGSVVDTSNLLTKTGNLSGLTDLAAARTALGLGTAATTAATAYATAAQGTTADNALPKAGGTMTGDITNSGTGRRMKADLSSATLANRYLFQTTTTDATSVLGILPNGTGGGAGWAAYSGSDLANTQFLELAHAKDAPAYLNIGKLGTAVQQAFAMLINGTEALRLSANGRFLLGQTSDDGVNKLQVTGSAKVITSGATSTLALTDSGANGVNLIMLGDGATTPSKTLRVKGGVFDILNDAGSSSIFKVANDGKVTLINDLAMGAMQITGVKNIAFENELDNGNGSTAKTIDVAAKRWQKLTLSASNCVISFTAPTVDGVWITTLRLVQDVSGNRAATWPASSSTYVYATGSYPYIELAPTRSTEVHIKAVRVSGTTTFFVSSVSF